MATHAETMKFYANFMLAQCRVEFDPHILMRVEIQFPDM